MLYVVLTALAFVMGFAIAWFGARIRIAMIESNLRGMANSISIHTAGQEQVPVVWVQDTLDGYIAREFR